MKPILAIAFALCGAFVVYQAVLGNAASTRLVAAYIVTSLVALALSATHAPWASKVKWIWVALSLVVIWSIVTGPLDMLRMPV